MHNILQNPYRITGLLAGATAREQSTQIRNLKRFLEAEQTPKEDFSFPCLGAFNRSLNDVETAETKLNLNADKMEAALFWFWNGNPITDEVAFEHLKNGEIEAAFNIWDKLIHGINIEGKEFRKPITERNFSAFHNYFVVSIIKKNDDLHTAIFANLKFLESEFLSKFINSVADETYQPTKKELQILFLTQLFQNTNAKITLTKLLEMVKKVDFIAKEDFLKSFAQKPITEITTEIGLAKQRDKSKPAECYRFGKKLMDNTKPQIQLLSSILDKSNLSYQSILDKLSQEILQCSIDYYNNTDEDNSVEKAMVLQKYALTIAVGSVAKGRCKENCEILESMKDKELEQAIAILQHIKDSYEENKWKIYQEIIKLEKTDLQIRLGYRSINLQAVEDNIKNSINWNAVNEMIEEILSDNNLKKIKENEDNNLKKEFLELANWLKTNSLKSSTITTIINKYKKIPPKLPFKILSSEITNTDNKPLYTKFIRYIGLKLNLQVTDSKSVVFYLKYIKPDGSIKTNSDTSPKGYSFSHTENLNIRNKSVELAGWGNSEKCTYDIGEHCIEVFVDDFLIHSKKFSVDIAPSEKLGIELKNAEAILVKIKNTPYFTKELEILKSEMNEIQEFQIFRTSSTKQMQISEQQKKIDDLKTKSSTEKAKLVEQQNKIIYKIKSDIQNAKY